MSGPDPLTIRTIVDSAAIFGPLCTVEIEIVLAMDAAFLEASAREQAEQQQRSPGGDK